MIFAPLCIALVVLAGCNGAQLPTRQQVAEPESTQEAALSSPTLATAEPTPTSAPPQMSDTLVTPEVVGVPTVIAEEYPPGRKGWVTAVAFQMTNPSDEDGVRTTYRVTAFDSDGEALTSRSDLSETYLHPGETRWVVFYDRHQGNEPTKAEVAPLSAVMLSPSPSDGATFEPISPEQAEVTNAEVVCDGSTVPLGCELTGDFVVNLPDADADISVSGITAVGIDESGQVVAAGNGAPGDDVPEISMQSGQTVPFEMVLHSADPQAVSEYIFHVEGVTVVSDL